MEINSYILDQHPYLQIASGIAGMPKRLYVKGNIPKQRWMSVAIIGTRRPTPYGNDVTFKLAYELAKKGIVIISGLAVGVDATAHRAALEADGITIAVLAHGLDTLYPAANKKLSKAIIRNGGALVSEYPYGVGAKPFQFLARNRIVSGLADAIIITEAAARSGTLSTAKHALEQGREVFVVPGNITSPMSAGANRLLLQGAHPALSVEEVLAVIRPDLLEKNIALPKGDTTEEDLLISLLSRGTNDGEALQKESGLPAAVFSSTLTMLEINGVIRSLGGNTWTLC